MPRTNPPPLSRRERQIMDIVYKLGEATAADIHSALEDPPTYTTVRGLLRILEKKKHLEHFVDGVRYVYRASTPRSIAGASVLSHVVRTFFDGSPSKAMAALLGGDKAHSEAEIERLRRLIDGAKGTARKNGDRK